MSKEMTAEEYLKRNTVHLDGYGDAIMPLDAQYACDLRAKEAVKEFAEDLMKWRFANNVDHESGEPTFSIRDKHGFATFATISMIIKHLAKQKGVEI